MWNKVLCFAQNWRFPSTGTLIPKFPEVRFHCTRIFNFTDYLDNFFDRSSYLYEEPGNLLKQELREPAIYNAIIKAIAEGASRMNDIKMKVGEENSVVSKYLKTLIGLGIAKKETPITEKPGKKTIYLLADNFFRFWYRFVPINMFTQWGLTLLKKYRNLLLNEKNELHNRNLHISELLNEEKVDIGNTKVDIHDRKVDIESVLSEKGSDFSVKTTVHIRRLFEKYGFDEVFGRSAVMELLELKGSGASKLLSNLMQADIIEPVSGHGKGKYKFKKRLDCRLVVRG